MVEKAPGPAGETPGQDRRPGGRPRTDGPVLPLQGRIGGAALEELGSVLDAALTATSVRVFLDLSAVTGWSLLAQAMVLNTSHAMSQRARHLVLVGPSPALRAQSRDLGVFDRVTTDPGD
jgi:anti-anti-sigma regulatory factor